MLTVHHLGVSQSDRVIWVCEELGLDYRLIRYERDPITQLAPPAYKALHPAGTAPVMTDGDVLLAESGAIVEYIARTYGSGRLIVAPGDPGFADYLYWFHFANASLMASGMIEIGLNLAGAGDAEHETLRSLRGRLDTFYAMIETHLATATWFAGDTFSLADIMMAFPLTTMRLFAPRDVGELPALRAYLARVSARPAFRAARMKGDPDLPVDLA